MRRSRKELGKWNFKKLPGHPNALWPDIVWSALGGLSWSAPGGVERCGIPRTAQRPQGRPAQPAQSRPNVIQPQCLRVPVAAQLCPNTLQAPKATQMIHDLSPSTQGGLVLHSLHRRRRAPKRHRHRGPRSENDGESRRLATNSLRTRMAPTGILLKDPSLANFEVAPGTPWNSRLEPT